MILQRFTMKKLICIVLCIAIFTVSGCGTILYPERANNPNSGRLDATVVLLDGLLCLFFVIPGVVAFVIDISNGSIYLPAGAIYSENNIESGEEVTLHFFDEDNDLIKSVTAEIQEEKISNKEHQDLFNTSASVSVEKEGEFLASIDLKKKKIVR